jgi:hypothetical protein
MTSVLSQESSILHPIDVPPSTASMSKTWTMMRLLETLLADEVDEVVLLGDDVYLTASGMKYSRCFLLNSYRRPVSLLCSCEYCIHSIHV